MNESLPASLEQRYVKAIRDMQSTQISLQKIATALGISRATLHAHINHPEKVWLSEAEKVFYMAYGGALGYPYTASVLKHKGPIQ